MEYIVRSLLECPARFAAMVVRSVELVKYVLIISLHSIM
jgi:hypothetical protein